MCPRALTVPPREQHLLLLTFKAATFDEETFFARLTFASVFSFGAFDDVARVESTSCEMIYTEEEII